MVGGLLVSQVLTLFTTPVDLPVLRSARPALVARAAARAVDALADASRMNLSAPFITRPVATTLLSSSAWCWPARSRFTLLPVSPLPQVDFPTIFVSAHPAGREPRDDGVDGGDAARARARHHRRRQRDHARTARRARPASTLQFDLGKRHRRRRARGAGGDQRRARRCCRARLPGMPTLPQDQPVAGADHGAGADLGRRATTEPDVRPRLDGAGAEGGAGHRRRRGHGRRRLAAGGARRAQPARARRSTASRSTRCARDLAAPTCCGRKGVGRGRRRATGRSRPATS